MEHVLPETGIKPLLIANALRWRHATKLFDRERIIPDDKLELLLESLRLAPSSINLQPWKFVVVKNKATRQVLRELAINQPQVTEASHLFILCSLKKINAAYYDRLIQLEKEQNKDKSMLELFKPVAMSFLESKTKEQLQEWMAAQVYIALGFLLSACALMHIDACPIEGFDHAKVNKLLDLHKKGIESQVMVAVGYRPNQEEYTIPAKIRWSREEVILTI